MIRFLPILARARIQMERVMDGAGLLRVRGLMPPGSKLIDSPGVPHSHQLSSLLNSDEASPFTCALLYFDQELASGRSFGIPFLEGLTCLHHQ